MDDYDDYDDYDVVIVVRCKGADVRSIRTAINTVSNDTQHAVFRSVPSRFNFGVELYNVCTKGMREMMETAKMWRDLR